MQSHSEDDLPRLSARARGAQRPRVRLGVGAAIVLLLAALVSAVLVSAVSQPASRRIDAGTVRTGASATPGVAAGSFTDPAVGTATPRPALLVHVLGAVRVPGLFELPPGARVMDAIVHAGGLDDTADPSAVNLARPLADGEQLYVPHLGEALPAEPPGTPAGAGPATGRGGVSSKVNINTATVADLDGLPHVGPMMAQRIIDYRTANGPFASVADLRNVTGIGDKTFESLKDLVGV